MPNWCEGTMKVRGKRKNVENFLLNGLNKYLFNPKTKEMDLMPKDQAVEVANDEYGEEIYISDGVYIEGTKRAFVDGWTVCLGSEEEMNTDIVIAVPFRQAWGIEPNDFDALKDKWDVDFRLFGVERGMGFDVEVIAERGEETICNVGNYGNYDEFLWECPFPYMGG